MTINLKEMTNENKQKKILLKFQSKKLIIFTFVYSLINLFVMINFFFKLFDFIYNLAHFNDEYSIGNYSLFTFIKK